jgi:hypothetical protein
MGEKTEEFIVSVPIVVSSIPVYDKVYLIPNIKHRELEN